MHYDELCLFPVLVLESSELFGKDKFDAADRAVALLADDDLCDVLLFGFGLVDLFAVDEHHDVGVLLYAVVNKEVIGHKIMRSLHSQIINVGFAIRLDRDNLIPVNITLSNFGQGIQADGLRYTRGAVATHILTPNSAEVRNFAK